MIKLPFDIELMNGRGEPSVFHIRDAGPEDLEKVMTLQSETVEALENKDIYATYTEEEALEVLETNRCFIALAENGDTAGYSVLIPNTRLDHENYGHYLGYADDRLAVTASFDLTMVAPLYRGHGLQRLFNKIRTAYALRDGAKESLTSISPENPYSYRNFLIMNYEIVDRRELYGGKDRYILRKEFK